jgi:predicted RNase H-like HicB family nuclease
MLKLNDYFYQESLGDIMKNKEIVFLVEESLDGGYEAKAAGFPIFTQGETIEEVKKNILDAVRCHFEISIAYKIFAAFPPNTNPVSLIR